MPALPRKKGKFFKNHKNSMGDLKWKNLSAFTEYYRVSTVGEWFLIRTYLYGNNELVVLATVILGMRSPRTEVTHLYKANVAGLKTFVGLLTETARNRTRLRLERFDELVSLLSLTYIWEQRSSSQESATRFVHSSRRWLLCKDFCKSHRNHGEVKC